MLAPFEHMLRNAVVHGIEPPDRRQTAGKAADGRIEMSLRREGSEVVIVVQDDGAGLDLAAIRAKAVATGLVNSRQTLSDADAMQLILEPGFSTASEVTQSAGRGVGMDVVVTEVKRLGGSLRIDSTSWSRHAIYDSAAVYVGCLTGVDSAGWSRVICVAVANGRERCPVAKVGRASAPE
jgi:chemosensory pili system protein ChpA (sensor histidine kinase/response regulator)